MKVFLFFVVVIALGSANPIGSATSKSSREDRVKAAIDNNVQWLLSGITNGNLMGSDLARAVVAVFLAEPGYFSVGHEIGRQLKSNSLLLRILLQQRPSNIPTEELALCVQALTVSCHIPRSPLRVFSHYLTKSLWESGIRSQRTGRFPANAFLALCNADATHHLVDLRPSTPFTSIDLTDEEAFTLMAIDCFESQYPWNLPEMQSFGAIRKSGYQYYPSNLTVEKLLELMNPDDDNTASLSAIGAAMQTLMYIHSLGVSDLPSAAVDFLLDNQDEDGSWGQSALNSFFILPALSGKSFRNINNNHCPLTGPATYADRDLFAEQSGELSWDYEIKFAYHLDDDSPILNRDYSNSLYDLLSVDLLWMKYKAIYQNGTDGKPYLTSFNGIRNRPEASYFWNTYEIALNPNGTLTRLTQSHADIEVKRNYRYVLWFSRASLQEDRSGRGKLPVWFSFCKTLFYYETHLAE